MPIRRVNPPDQGGWVRPPLEIRSNVAGNEVMSTVPLRDRRSCWPWAEAGSFRLRVGVRRMWSPIGTPVMRRYPVCRGPVAGVVRTDDHRSRCWPPGQSSTLVWASALCLHSAVVALKWVVLVLIGVVERRRDQALDHVRKGRSSVGENLRRGAMRRQRRGEEPFVLSRCSCGWWRGNARLIWPC